MDPARRWDVPLTDALPKPLEEALTANSGEGSDVVIAVAGERVELARYTNAWQSRFPCPNVERGAWSLEPLRRSVERRYLVPAIRRVIAVKERFGTVDWEVETDRGVCRFTMRSPRENVLQPSPGRYLLTDVDGNRYDVRDLAALNAVSRVLLLRHL